MRLRCCANSEALTSVHSLCLQALTSTRSLTTRCLRLASQSVAGGGLLLAAVGAGLGCAAAFAAAGLVLPCASVLLVLA